MQNSTHLKIARILNIVLSVIIFILLSLTIYYSYKPIKNYLVVFGATHFNKLSSTTTLTPDQVLDSIRKKIIPSIVEVRCADDDSGVEKWIGSGIYYLDGTDSVPTVQTNAHVALGSDGKFHACNVYFPRPDDGSFYDSSYSVGTAYLYHDQISTVDGTEVDGLDLAQLVLTAPNKDGNGTEYVFPPKATDAFKAINDICKNPDSEIKIGDKIYIIGYPETGGDSITLTEGVVSGFSGDGQNLIKISASTNHGNSGGIVMDQNTGCYDGIVESATFETGNNLGYVMSSGFISSFLSNTTGQAINNLIATDTDPSEYLTNQIKVSDISVPYPKNWIVATSTDPDVGIVTSVIAPLENALDVFKKGLVFNVLDIGQLKPSKALQQKIASIRKILTANGITQVRERDFALSKKITVHEILFLDKDGVIYNAPSIVTDFLFVYKGNLYFISGLAGATNTFGNYLVVFENMVNAIVFN